MKNAEWNQRFRPYIPPIPKKSKETEKETKELPTNVKNTEIR